MITDHDAELRALLHATLDRAAFGQDWGFLVTSSVVAVQGSFQVTRQVVITLASPLLGHPPLMHTFPVLFGLADHVIVGKISQGMADLRQAATSVLAQGNGKSVQAGAK